MAGGRRGGLLSVGRFLSIRHLSFVISPMPLHDITRPLHDSLAPWPGDTGFAFHLNWKMADGAPVNVGALTMGVHNGTHADAPRHFLPDGATVESLPLDVFIGPAVVLDLSGRPDRHGPVTRGDLAPALAALAHAPRLLLKTDAAPDPTRFPADFPTLAPGVAAFLGERGVRLLGVDVPSVDPADSKDLPNHHALAAAGIAILENLALHAVAAGVYELFAAPLPIVGGDAAPVRAVLRETV